MGKRREKLAALERRQAQIRTQIQALKARDNVQERKDETRRKVMVGGFIWDQMRKRNMQAQGLVFEGVRFVDTLRTDKDRKLFGLPPLSPSGEDGGAV